MDREFVECREVMDRVRIILGKKIDGIVRDWHIADELDIPYSTYRTSVIFKNRIPFKQLARFSYKNNINLTELIY